MSPPASEAGLRHRQWRWKTSDKTGQKTVVPGVLAANPKAYARTLRNDLGLLADEPRPLRAAPSGERSRREPLARLVGRHPHDRQLRRAASGPPGCGEESMPGRDPKLGGDILAEPIAHPRREAPVLANGGVRPMDRESEAGATQDCGHVRMPTRGEADAAGHPGTRAPSTSVAAPRGERAHGRNEHWRQGHVLGRQRARLPRVCGRRSLSKA